MPRVAIVGAGAWGTTLSILCAEKGYSVSLWVYERDLCEEIQKNHENSRFLSGIPIPSNVEVTSELPKALRDAEHVFLAVPAGFLRNVVRLIKEILPWRALLCSLTKGLDESSGDSPSAIIEKELGKSIRKRLAVLSGPNLAREIAQKLPAATVVASRNWGTAERFQKLLMVDRLRVYTSRDVVGVEWGGVLKNIIAIAAGISDGLKLGDNAKAGVITRGLSEMVRFGVAQGAKRETFFGLSGLGDLLCTCSSSLSRNHRVGEALGRGESLE